MDIKTHKHYSFSLYLNYNELQTLQLALEYTKTKEHFESCYWNLSPRSEIEELSEKIEKEMAKIDLNK